MRPLLPLALAFTLVSPAVAQKGAQKDARKPAPAPAPKGAPDLPSKLPAGSPVAKVNGEAIPLTRYIDRLSLEHGPDIREALILEQLIRQEAARRKITATPAELESVVERTYSATIANYPGEKELAQDLKRKRGWSTADYKAVIRSQADIQVLKEKIAAAMVKPASITAEQIEKRYNEKKQTFIQPDTVRITHILIKKSETGEGEKERRAKAEALLKKISSDGKNFEDLARENTEDEGTKMSAGRIPVDISKGVHPFGGTFDTVVYAAPVGVIRQVIPGPLGYQLVRVDSKKEGRTLQLADVKEQIVASLLAEERERAFGEKMIQLRGAAKIDTGKF